MTNRLKTILIIIGGILILIVPMVTQFDIKLTYNPSPSAPIGFYWVKADGVLKRGAYIVVPTPPRFRMMAAKRHYLPLNVPLIKRVVALSGDEICRYHDVVYVNKIPVAIAKKYDSEDRVLPDWQGCLILKEDQFFALMDAPNSFDGRYFGPLNVIDILGIAYPIYTTDPPDSEYIFMNELRDIESLDRSERRAR